MTAGRPGALNSRCRQRCPTGQQAATPIGLGQVGDIEFWAPNRGLLITAGNPPTIPPGVWAYNGVAWHELSTVCGASDGRIAWAGPDEFWTISDGRPGQANIEGNPAAGRQHAVPLRRRPGRRLLRLARLPAELLPGDARCGVPRSRRLLVRRRPAPDRPGRRLSPALGRPLADGRTQPPGARGRGPAQLRRQAVRERAHSTTATAQRTGTAHRTVRPAPDRAQRGATPGSSRCCPACRSTPKGSSPRRSASCTSAPTNRRCGGRPTRPSRRRKAPRQGQVTVLRYAQGQWSQLLGPTTEPEGHNPSPPKPKKAPTAAGPTKWSARSPSEPPSEAEQARGERKRLAGAQLPANSGERTAGVRAPGARGRRRDDRRTSDRCPPTRKRCEGVGPKGAASKIACPAPDDCWMATSQGWLFHLAAAQTNGACPKTPTRPSPGSSPTARRTPASHRCRPTRHRKTTPGLTEGPPAVWHPHRRSLRATGEARVAGAAVLRHSHPARARHTLELSFRLAVQARVRLLAKRHKRVVASTPMRTLAAGNRTLLLRLDRTLWPTNLALRSHALAPLPTVSAAARGNEHRSHRPGGAPAYDLPVREAWDRSVETRSRHERGGFRRPVLPWARSCSRRAGARPAGAFGGSGVPVATRRRSDERGRTHGADRRLGARRARSRCSAPLPRRPPGRRGASAKLGRSTSSSWAIVQLHDRKRVVAGPRSARRRGAAAVRIRTGPQPTDWGDDPRRRRCAARQSGGWRTQVVLVRNPGGAFTETAPVPDRRRHTLAAGEEPLLKATSSSSAPRAPRWWPHWKKPAAWPGRSSCPSVKARAWRTRFCTGTATGGRPSRSTLPKASEEKGGFRVLAIAASPHGSVAAGPALLGVAAPSRCFAATPAKVGPRAGSRSRRAPGQAAGAPLQVTTVGESVPFAVPGTGEPPTTQAQILTVTDKGSGSTANAPIRARTADAVLQARGGRSREQRRSAGELVQRRLAGSGLHRPARRRSAADRTLAELRLGEPLRLDTVRRTCHHRPR